MQTYPCGKWEEKIIANNIHTISPILLLMEVTLPPLETTGVLPFSPKIDRREPKNNILEDISWISKPFPQLLQKHIMIPVTYVSSSIGKITSLRGCFSAPSTCAAGLFQNLPPLIFC